jgi:formamidopyrimidine-DNA glycosylase
MTTNTDKEITLVIEDKIKLSKVQIYNDVENIKFLDKLGPDIFTSEFNIENFKTKITSKNMMLVNFLLKQENFSGIGNYIKNEVLYIGNLEPIVKTKDLTNAQINDLYKNILYVAYSCLMEHLTSANISDCLLAKNSVNKPNKLQIPYKYKIYGRTITDNGEKVKKITIGGRTTYTIM